MVISGIGEKRLNRDPAVMTLTKVEARLTLVEGKGGGVAEERGGVAARHAMFYPPTEPLPAIYRRQITLEISHVFLKL